MTYLLDTNACIVLINNKTPLVRTRLQKALAAHERVLVSSVVAFELWYGVAKSARPEANARLVGVPPATVDEFTKLFSQGEGA